MLKTVPYLEGEEAVEYEAGYSGALPSGSGLLYGTRDT